MNLVLVLVLVLIFLLLGLLSGLVLAAELIFIADIVLLIRNREIMSL